MKKIVGFAICLALSAIVCKGDGFEDWFTPSGGFSSQPTFDVWISVGGYEDTIPLAITSDIDEIGYWVDFYSTGIPVSAKNAFETAKAALISAMYAQCQSKLNECKINNLASAIEGLVVANYGEYHDSGGRVLSKSKANVARDQLLKSKNSIVAGNGATEGTQDDPLVVEVLETPFSSQTFEQDTRTDGESKTILKGVPALSEVSGSSFPFSSGLYLATGWVPLITSKDGDLTWKAWNGVDTDVLGVSAGTGGRDGKLCLTDWKGGNGGCDLNLKGLLTDSKDPDYQAARKSHTFLTRCKDGDEYKLHYMSVGDVIDSITPVEPDDESIEKYINDSNETNLQLYAWQEAKEAAGASENGVPYLPYANGENSLAWDSFDSFFNENVFTVDDEGKIILNGVEEAGEDDVMLVTAKGSDSGQEIKVRKLDANAFETKTGEDLSLKGMQDTSTDYLFEDESIAGLSEVPVKVAGNDGYELEWRVWGGVDGGVFEANEDTDHLLSILGWNDNDHDCESNLSTMMTEESGANRADHKIFTKYQNGEVHWVPLGGRLQPIPECDDYTVTTNENYGASTHGKLSIAGVSDAETDSASSKIPYIPNVNGQDSFTWSPVTDFFLSGVFKKTSEGKIALKGLDDSDSDSIKVISVEGEDDEQTISALKFDKKSIAKNGSGEIEVANFKEGTAPVQGANFADILTNATTYANMYVMVKDGLGDGMTVKYAPLGKLSSLTSGKINPCATDDESVTTNETLGARTANIASLYGWTTAADSATTAEPQVPYTDGEDKLKWKKPLDFFEAGQFDKTSEGKIVLKGLGKEPTSGTRFLSAEYDEEENATFKPMTLDGGFTEKEGAISISRWDESAETRSLAEMLTNSENYASVTIMGRDTQTDGEEDAVIKYYPLGKILADTIDISEPDEYSITTNSDNGAKFDGYLSIYGLADAEVDSTDEPYLAYVNGEDSFAWHPVSDLFNENVFKVDEDGKIVLSGIEDAGEDDVMLVTAKGADSSQEVKVKKIDGDTFDVSEDSDLTLLGFNDATTEYLWEDEDIFGLADIPVKVSVNDGYTLEWRAWGGVDGDALVVDTDHALTIAGFKDGDHDCEDDLTTMLTDKDDADNRNRHAFLSRYTDGSTKSLHWVSVGDLIDTEFHIDAVSITTNAEDGAVLDGEMSLFGFATADEAASSAEEKGFVPFADGSGELNWAGMSAFFSDNIFDKTSDGRIKLRGVGEERGKVKVLAVSGGSDEDSSELSGFSGDGVSVDFGIDRQGQSQSPQAQLHKFDTAPSPYGASGLNFADSLTNANTTISGMSVPVRFVNGGKAEIGYIPMGKVTGIPQEVKVPVDDKTIATNAEHGAFSENVASIYGASDASRYDLPSMGENHIEWNNITYFADGKSIDDTTPAAGEKPKIKLKGWNDYDIGVFCNFLGEGSVYSLRGITLNTTTKTMYPDNIGDASLYSVPYKSSMNESGNDRMLNWSSPPQSGVGVMTVKSGQAPTFTGVADCQDNLSKMLTDKDDSENRSKHKFLAKYNDDSFHWVSVGNTIKGGGVEVDDASITTNTTHGAVTADEASIYGFASASDNAIPYKKNNAGSKSVDWVSPPTGATSQNPKFLQFNGSSFAWGDSKQTIRFIGTDGTAVDVGSGENVKEVTFASASDSNVTVSCETNGVGGAKITIGVYWFTGSNE